jgi:hypothetical protein
MELTEAENYYTNIGFAGRVGFGHQPALLIIDCNYGCANPAVSPIGIAMDGEIRHIRRLLDLARRKGFPVVHTTVVYSERPLTHMVNLFDMDSKYGDIMDIEDVIAAFQRLPAAP